jgi:hypothetical protein
MWKNYLLKRRNLCSTCCEILLPVGVRRAEPRGWAAAPFRRTGSAPPRAAPRTPLCGTLHHLRHHPAPATAAPSTPPPLCSWS